MQKTITGYQFFEKEMATEKRSELVSVKALPKKEKDVTLYWQDYEEAAFDKPTFWYMRGDDSMISTLGKPSKFKVTFPDPPKEEPGEGGGGKIPIKGK